ncbi:MAG: hypothetical protein WDN04_19660 [Rhodospirillales bacterium]
MHLPRHHQLERRGIRAPVLLRHAGLEKLAGDIEEMPAIKPGQRDNQGVHQRTAAFAHAEHEACGRRVAGCRHGKIHGAAGGELNSDCRHYKTVMTSKEDGTWAGAFDAAPRVAMARCLGYEASSHPVKGSAPGPMSRTGAAARTFHCVGANRAG